MVTKPCTKDTSTGCARYYNIDVNTSDTNLAEKNSMKKEMSRLSTLLLNEVKSTSKRGEFENHAKSFGSNYMKNFVSVDGKGLRKHDQGSKDPIPLMKNNYTMDMGSKSFVHGMPQLGARVVCKQQNYNNPTKFNYSQDGLLKPYASEVM